METTPAYTKSFWGFQMNNGFYEYEIRVKVFYI